MNHLQNIGDDLLSLILNQQQLDQNLLSCVSKTVRDTVYTRASKFIRIKSSACDNELFMFEELCIYIPKYDRTTIFYDNSEWYIPF